MTDGLDVRFKRLRLPGRAGGLQDGSERHEFVAELGDNYELYHDFLAKQLDGLGGRPHPADFKDPADCLRASALAQEIVVAEALLRAGRAWRRGDMTPSPQSADSVPLFDRDFRLVHVDAEIEPATELAAPREPDAGWPPSELSERDKVRRREGDQNAKMDNLVAPAKLGNLQRP